MAGKSKKTIALILSAMMAAAALAGCGPSSGGESSTPAGNTGSSQGGSENSSSGGQVQTTDVFSEEVTKQIKDAIAQEAEKEGGVVTLTVWCASGDKDFEQSRMDAFEKLYADSRYTFKLKKKVMGESDAGTKINEDPKVGADVFNFADDQLRDLVTAGAIAEVSPLFFNNVKVENTPESVEVCSIDGKPYAFPKTSDNGFFLYYDKDTFTEEDIKTFDGLIAKAAEKNTNVLMALDNAWYNTGFFFTAGCTVSLDGKKQQADFNTENGKNAVKAMCHIAENVDKGFIGTGDDTVVVQGFQDGRIKAAVTGTWNGAAIKRAIGSDKVGAAKLPTILINGEQKQLCSFGGYKVIGVNAYSKFPTAAQTLAYYFSCEESQKLRYSGSEVSRGLIPTNINALAVDEIKNDPAAQAIEAQRPFSQPQSNVGGKYWTPIGALGGEVVTAKGNLTDDRINQIIQDALKSFE